MGPDRTPAPGPIRAPGRGRRALLWREAVGHELRTERRDRRERLSDVADRAGISVPYLSEIERGRKEPSSEILAAVVGALGLTLSALAARVALLTGDAEVLLDLVGGGEPDVVHDLTGDATLADPRFDAPVLLAA